MAELDQGGAGPSKIATNITNSPGRSRKVNHAAYDIGDYQYQDQTHQYEDPTQDGRMEDDLAQEFATMTLTEQTPGTAHPKEGKTVTKKRESNAR